MVPLFISVGEMIKVDTRNDSYHGPRKLMVEIG